MDRILISAVMVVLIVIVAFNLFTAQTQIQTQIVQTTTTTTTLEIPTTTTTLPAEMGYQAVTIKVPAVDREGNGVVTLLKVQAMPGEGRALVNINQLLFWVDTQYSIRVAKTVAENTTGLDLSNVDLIYSIETNASVIEGQSAGAALTIATVAVLEDKTVVPDVMITGTIDFDGSIGPVGAIIAKASAAKDVGASLFLVPTGQASQTYYTPVRKCEKIGPVTYCTTEYKAEKIDVTKEAGIPVKEVGSIEEALKYFLT